MAVNLLSRESFLALAQTLQIASLLREQGTLGKLTTLKTEGDTNLSEPLYKVEGGGKEGKAFFTKELEDGLLAGAGDLAVHSLKDLPTELPNGLTLATMALPTDASDMLVATSQLAPGYSPGPEITIGTSSLRRMAQLRALAPQAKIIPIRGNVITRLEKLARGEDGMTALLLATAGIERLFAFYKQWQEERELWIGQLGDDVVKRLDDDTGRLTALLDQSLHYYRIDPECFLPAVAQGVLGLEAASTNESVLAWAAEAFTIDATTLGRVKLERTLLRRLEAGCHLPLGIHITRDQQLAAFRVSVFFDEHYNPEQEATGKPLVLHRILRGADDPCLDELVSELHGKRPSIAYTGISLRALANIDNLTHIPLVETIASEMTAPQYKEYAWAVVTSRNALKYVDLKALPSVNRWIAVGPATAKVVEESLNVEAIVPGTNNALGSAITLLDVETRGPVLWIGARGGVRDGIELLQEAELEVDELNPYQTVARAAKPIDARLWVFSSPSAVDSYFDQGLANDAHLYSCLGMTTARRLLDHGAIPYHVASRSELQTLAEELTGRRTNPPWKLQPWSHHEQV